MNPTTKTTGFIYVIHAIGTDRYKIGYTLNPKARLEHLQTGSPYKLKMIASWPGAPADEKFLHRQLADFRKIGEWFELPEGKARKISAQALRPRPPKKPARVYHRTPAASWPPAAVLTEADRQALTEDFDYLAAESTDIGRSLAEIKEQTPELAPVLSVLAGRADLMLKIASNCRRVAVA